MLDRHDAELYARTLIETNKQIDEFTKTFKRYDRVVSILVTVCSALAGVAVYWLVCKT